MHFADQIHKNDVILLDNESIMLIVDIISTTTITCMIERGGTLGSFKDVFVPNVVFDMPNYSDRDIGFINMIVHHQVSIFLFMYICYG